MIRSSKQAGDDNKRLSCNSEVIVLNCTHDKTTFLSSFHPARGTSWEGFVIEQVISAFQLLSPGCQAFYWRTAAGAEVDLLIKRGERHIPLEIKLHSSPSGRDVPGLVSCMKDLKLNSGYVLYPGGEDYSIGQGITVLSTEKLLAQPQRLLKL